jgi:hypothetical protein
MRGDRTGVCAARHRSSLERARCPRWLVRLGRARSVCERARHLGQGSRSPLHRLPVHALSLYAVWCARRLVLVPGLGSLFYFCNEVFKLSALSLPSPSPMPSLPKPAGHEPTLSSLVDACAYHPVARGGPSGCRWWVRSCWRPAPKRGSGMTGMSRWDARAVGWNALNASTRVSRGV